MVLLFLFVIILCYGSVWATVPQRDHESSRVETNVIAIAMSLGRGMCQLKQRLKLILSLLSLKMKAPSVF